MSEFFKKLRMRFRVTVYPRDSAMHGAVQIGVPHFGWVTFMPNYWGKKNWTLTISHNATPWAATFIAGPGASQQDKTAARVRRALFGFGRRSLAWCQEIGNVVGMAEFVASEYGDDPPVGPHDLERRREARRAAEEGPAHV